MHYIFIANIIYTQLLEIYMKFKYLLVIAFTLFSSSVFADEEIGCVTTAWKLLGANHKVCVSAFNDPEIPGVTCHISQAKTGGISGAVGLAEDASEFSLACRQTGPITLPNNLKTGEEVNVFAKNTNIFFKSTDVHRMWDKTNNTLVYLAISRKVIEGSPKNSISTVPVMPWGK